MKKSLIISILLVASLYASEVFTEYSALPEGNQVVINWITKSEVGVKHFAIQRSMNGSNYVELATVDVQGAGHRYQYEDKDVLVNFSGAIFYKIVAIRQNDDGAQLENVASEPMIVHPNISGIFRTWGAIKAMFR